jgi:hypothetical protein
VFGRAADGTLLVLAAPCRHRRPYTRVVAYRIRSSPALVLAVATLMACAPHHTRYYYADTALAPAQALDVAHAEATKVAGTRNQSRHDERRATLAAEETEREHRQQELDAIKNRLLQPDLDAFEYTTLIRRQHHLEQTLSAPLAVDYEHIEVARAAEELHITSEHRTVDGSRPTHGSRRVARVQAAKARAGSRVEVALTRTEDANLVLASMLGIGWEPGRDCTPSKGANPRTCDIRRGGPLEVSRLAIVSRTRTLGRFDRASVELGSELGMGVDPAIENTALGYRITGRAGIQWRARGGRGHEWQLWSLAGIGPGLRGGNTNCQEPCPRSIIGLEPELVLRLSRVPVAELVPGHRIPLDHGMDLDLRITGVFDELDRSGLSAALVVRRPGLGGVFARAGHMWGVDGGVTWSAGIEMDSAATLGGLLGAALVVGALQGLGKGIRDVAVGNE